jgi:hypothetical protein
MVLGGGNLLSLWKLLNGRGRAFTSGGQEQVCVGSLTWSICRSLASAPLMTFGGNCLIGVPYAAPVLLDYLKWSLLVLPAGLFFLFWFCATPLFARIPLLTLILGVFLPFSCTFFSTAQLSWPFQTRLLIHKGSHNPSIKFLEACFNDFQKPHFDNSQTACYCVLLVPSRNFFFSAELHGHFL